MDIVNQTDPDIQEEWQCECSPFFDHECGKPETPREAYTPPPEPAPTPPVKHRGFLKGPIKDNECPHLPKTSAALEWGLGELGVDVRQNLRRHTVEWRKDGGEWVLLNGRAAARFRSDLEERFIIDSYRGPIPLKFGRELFNEALDSLLFDKEVDPFVQYLDTLEPPTGRRKLSGSLAHCFDIALWFWW